MSIKGRAIAAVIGATALLGGGTAAAQEAGDMVLGAGWLGFYPQDSSKPLTFTSPRHFEVAGSKSLVSNAHTLGLSFLYYFSSQWAVEAVIGIFYFRALDRVIGVFPILNRMLLGTDDNLVSTYFAVSGPWGDPRARIIPSKSIASPPPAAGRSALPSCSALDWRCGAPMRG